MSVLEFCDRHVACSQGREWALANCRDMDHAWETLSPEWLIWVGTRRGVLDDRNLRLFAVWCARQVQHLMTDPRSVAAVDVAERFANGDATAEELKAARAAAWAAAGAAAWAAAGAAADAAGAAAVAAAGAAADAARDAAARDARAAGAAGAAARAAAWAAAWHQSLKLQAEWLRANAKPNWETKP